MTYTYSAGNLGKASDFIHFIGYVNAPHLFEKAVTSTIPAAKEGVGIIIDNRSDKSVPSPNQIIEGKEAAECFSVLEPDVPLTFSQTMNLLIKVSIQKGAKFFTWIHADGEVTGDSLNLIRTARQHIADGTKWGAIFTCYDVYSAFSVEGWQATGEWDWLRFPFYFSDTDYYRRLEAAGYPYLNIGGEGVIHHNNASNTIKHDELRRMTNDYMFPVWKKLFDEKYPEQTT